MVERESIIPPPATLPARGRLEPGGPAARPLGRGARSRRSPGRSGGGTTRCRRGCSASSPLALLILFGPVLCSGGILLPLDNLRGQVPFQRARAHRAARQSPPGGPDPARHPVARRRPRRLVGGALAALEPRGRAPGMPLLADPQAQALQPLVLLGYPLPLARAAGVVAALRVLARLDLRLPLDAPAGIGGGPRRSPAPSPSGSAASSCSGWAGRSPIRRRSCRSSSTPWPAATMPGGRRDALLLALGTLALLLGGHPETIVYALGMALPLPPRPSAPPPAGIALGAGPPGGAGDGGRRDGGGAGPAAGDRISPQDAAGGADGGGGPRRGGRRPRWEPCRPDLSPARRSQRLRQQPRSPTYWGLANSNEDASGFVGTATLLAALLAVRARRRFPAGAAGAGDRRRLPAAPALLPGAPRWRATASCCRCRSASPIWRACTLERFRLGEVRRWPLLIAAVGLASDHRLGVSRPPRSRGPRSASRSSASAGCAGSSASSGSPPCCSPSAASWRRPGRSLAVAGVAAAILAELLLLHRPANPPMPRQMPLPVNGPIAFLQWKLGQPPARPRLPDGGARPGLPAQPRDALRAGGRADLQPHGAAGVRRRGSRRSSPAGGGRSRSSARRATRSTAVSACAISWRPRTPGSRPRSQRVFADADGSVWEQPGRRGRASSSPPAPGSRRSPSPAPKTPGSPPRSTSNAPGASPPWSTRTAAGGSW